MDGHGRLTGEARQAGRAIERVERVTKNGKKDMYQDLMDEFVSKANVQAALRAFKCNKGKPGIDAMTTLVPSDLAQQA